MIEPIDDTCLQVLKLIDKMDHHEGDDVSDYASYLRELAEQALDKVIPGADLSKRTLILDWVYFVHCGPYLPVVLKADKEWFSKHPNASCLVRRLYPHEMFKVFKHSGEYQPFALVHRTPSDAATEEYECTVYVLVIHGSHSLNLWDDNVLDFLMGWVFPLRSAGKLS